MDSYLKLVVLGLSMGAGMMLILIFGKRLFKPKRPVGFIEWMYRIENRGARMLHDECVAVESKAEFFDLLNIDEIPRDFEPTIFLMSNVTSHIQRIVLLRLEAEGIVTKGTFAQMFPQAMEVAPKVDFRSEPAPKEPAPLRLVTPNEPDHDWVDGRIVPKVSAS